MYPPPPPPHLNLNIYQILSCPRIPIEQSVDRAGTLAASDGARTPPLFAHILHAIVWPLLRHTKLYIMGALPCHIIIPF
jgi:hypothetical protein